MKTNIPYGRHNIDDEDKHAMLEALESNWLTQGPLVPSFERLIREYCGVSYAVAVTNATSALFSACAALGIKQGDKVWVSAISFVASANAPIMCGANVEFVDIELDTINICTKKLALQLERAEREGRLPKLLIVVHMGGASSDMQSIQALKDKYKFQILEDASHAIGGEYNNKKIGSCEFSDACVFSFHPVKIITTGEGGMITTNSKELAAKLCQMRSHGIIRCDPNEAYQFDEIWNYKQISLGHNFRMTDLQASLGISQFKKLERFIQTRNSLALKYKEGLNNLPFTFQKVLNNAKSSYHLFVIILNEAHFNERNALYEYLTKNNISVNLHYNPIYLQPYYLNNGFQRGYCPNSEIYAKSAITLPLYPAIKKEEFEWVLSNVRTFFSKG